ncbi:MAG: hypothetical protein ACYDCQ_00920, partial [Dehalococcoidia bacterium]
GEALLLPLVERISGVAYLRASAGLALLAFPAFLLVPGVVPKLMLVALLGLLHAGWYAIPSGRLYSELPGASGAAVALSNVSSFAGHLLPLCVGLIAERLGLAAAMWLLLAAPVALLLGLVGVPATRGADAMDCGEG